MAPKPKSSDPKRDRLMALVLLLQNATKDKPLTQDEIIRDLTIDDPKSNKLMKAYEGDRLAVRQKFERDKKDIRSNGIQVETSVSGDGTSGYWIDADSMAAVGIFFDEQEERVIRLALRLYGFGKHGVFSIFNDGPGTDGSLAISNYYNPLVRAIKLKRAVSFDYRSTKLKNRVVEPLRIATFDGSSYLIARTKEDGVLKSYKIDRITSMPEVLPQKFEVSESDSRNAESWSPNFSPAESAIVLTVVAKKTYAELICQQQPQATSREKKSGLVELNLPFDTPHAAMQFLLQAGERVVLEDPKDIKKEFISWLKEVNKGSAPSTDGLVFSEPERSDVLGQTLLLLHAVYASPEGLTVGELSSRFAMDPADVRRIMDRLFTLEIFDGSNNFPAHITRIDDEDDEDPDSLEILYLPETDNGTQLPNSLMWRDVFELNVALREATRVYSDSAILSAIDKLEEASGVYLGAESSGVEAFIPEITDAVNNKKQITILYTSGQSDETRERAIEPRDIKRLNGHTYIRAYCTTSEGWRTFRVDRISAVLSTTPVDQQRVNDVEENWLTQIGSGGEEVVVFVDANSRWLFEPLPGARWAVTKDGESVVMFRVSDEEFLNNLMLQAGPGARVSTPKFKKAGHELAKRILKNL